MADCVLSHPIFTIFFMIPDLSRLHLIAMDSFTVLMPMGLPQYTMSTIGLCTPFATNLRMGPEQKEN